MDKLDEAISVEILSFMDMWTCLSMSGVSKFFHKVTQKPRVWHGLNLFEFKICFCGRITCKDSFKDQYSKRCTCFDFRTKSSPELLMEELTLPIERPRFKTTPILSEHYILGIIHGSVLFDHSALSSGAKDPVLKNPQAVIQRFEALKNPFSSAKKLRQSQELLDLEEILHEELVNLRVAELPRFTLDHIVQIGY